MGANDLTSRTLSEAAAAQVRAIFDGQAAESEEFAGDVTATLREALLRGLVPAGTWLTEEGVAKILGVSRTPAREAIRQLEAERLAVRNGASATVRKMSTDDIFAVYVVREALEGLAARQVAARRSAELVAELESLNAKLREVEDSRKPGAALTAEQVDAVSAANRRFHRLLYQATDNEYLQWFLRQVENAIRRSGVTTFDLPETLGEVVKEHELIIEAVRLGDTELAEQYARTHAKESRRRRIHLHLGRY